MNKFLVACFIMLASAASLFSQEAESLASAKELSAQSGKPILLEFVRSD